jgi:cell division protein FtsB
LRRLFRQLWPAKTAQHLALAADVTVRQAERLLAGEQGMSYAVFERLLNGAQGYAFLRHAMRNARPDWWREIDQERRLGELRKQRKALERQLKQLEEG